MKSIYKLLTVAASAALFTACLKDKKIDNGEYGLSVDNGKIVELSGPPNHFLAIGLDFKNADTTFGIVTVNLASGQVAQEDITVVLTLANSATLISDYNLAAGTSFSQLPSNLYSFQGGGLTVTIPRGSNVGYAMVKVNPSQLGSGNYALGFSIASISTPGYTISGNFKNIIVAIGVKNKYDGVYSLKFKMLDWAAAFGISNAVHTWPLGITMITSGSASVKMFSVGHAAYIHPAITTVGGLTGFGSTEPQFTFDPTTNKLIAVNNDFVNPSNGRTFVLNPAVTDSRWDPATRTIYAAIIMKQPGRTDLQIFDTLSYLGPR